MKPYETLAHAIIMQAVADYKKALNKLQKRKRNKEAKGTKQECERFFRSRWFSQLSNIDGEYLIRKVKENNITLVRDVALL